MTVVSILQPSLKVETALRQASTKTGIDFDYLLRTAKRESAFKSDIKSKTSSATGLFQFIDQTWFGMVKKAGAAIGLGSLADAIKTGSNGRHFIADAKSRSAILALRKDPKTASYMAGVFTKDNADYLKSTLGRAPTKGDLYVAHVLGAGGAAKLISSAARTPQVAAAKLFPAAAAANKSIFYSRSGKPRSLAAVYQNLASRYQNTKVATASTKPAVATPQASPATPGVTPAIAAQKFVTPPLSKAAAWANTHFNVHSRAQYLQIAAPGPAQTDAPRARNAPLNIIPPGLKAAITKAGLFAGLYSLRPQVPQTSIAPTGIASTKVASTRVVSTKVVPTGAVPASARPTTNVRMAAYLPDRAVRTLDLFRNLPVQRTNEAGVDTKTTAPAGDRQVARPALGMRPFLHNLFTTGATRPLV